MTKNKLERFAELATFPNVVQLNPEYKGKWAAEFFKNNFPIVLELACGKGEYTVALAKKFPQKNFIGIDIKGNRIWKGAKQAVEEKISNAGFLRIQIDHITEYFSENEISEIWLTFPDPYLKKSKANKRLTSKRFLDLYKKILKPDGIIHLKTDSDLLYDFTLETVRENKFNLLKSTNNLYNSDSNALPFGESWGEASSVKTFYEQQHLANGKTIKYLSFTLQQIK